MAGPSSEGRVTPPTAPCNCKRHPCLQRLLKQLELGAARVVWPYGFALANPGMRPSRTRLFPRVTRVKPMALCTARSSGVEQASAFVSPKPGTSCAGCSCAPCGTKSIVPALSIGLAPAAARPSAASWTKALACAPRDKFHRPKARMATRKAAMAMAHKRLAWLPPSTCSNAASPSPISGPTTSTASISAARPSAWPAASTRSATTPCSVPRLWLDQACSGIYPCQGRPTKFLGQPESSQ